MDFIDFSRDAPKAEGVEKAAETQTPLSPDYFINQVAFRALHVAHMAADYGRDTRFITCGYSCNTFSTNSPNKVFAQANHARVNLVGSSL